MHLDKNITINTKTRCIAQTEKSRKLLDNKLILSRIQQHFLRQAKNFTEQINYPNLLQEVQNALDNIKKELEVLRKLGKINFMERMSLLWSEKMYRTYTDVIVLIT